MKKNKDNCCDSSRNQSINTGKAQYQLLLNEDSTGDLSIIPNGNTVNLTGIVKTCETVSQISTFRLVSNSILELIYIGEDLIPVSKTVDLSGLAVTAIPFTVADTNTILLNVDGNGELTANVNLDPSSTAPVSASAAGIKFDCCPETPLVASTSDTLILNSSGTNGHTLSGAVKFTDTNTVAITSGSSGLAAGVKLSNSSKQMITEDANGLLVNEDDVLALINDTQTVDVDAPLEYDAINNVISLPVSTSIDDGYLSSEDWTRFDSKVDPTRSIGTNLPLTGGGDLSINRTLSILQANTTQSGYLSNTDFLSFSNKLDSSRIIATTAPLTGGGPLTSDLNISIPQASGVVSGYLRNTDWVIFNAKVDSAVNLTGGAGIFKQKTPPGILEFRSLTGTAGQIVVTQNADTVNIGIDPTFSSGGGGGTDLIIKDEGSNITTAAVSINFAGAGVTATNSSGDVTVTIPGQTFTIANVTYTDGTYTANIADADKVVFLKAATANLVYNINPATFSGRKIILYCNQTGSFTVTINATSGTLGLATSYVAVDHESLTVYSDGTNLYTIAKN